MNISPVTSPNTVYYTCHLLNSKNIILKLTILLIIKLNKLTLIRKQTNKYVKGGHWSISLNVSVSFKIKGL